MDNNDFSQDWGKFLEEAKELERQAEEEAMEEASSFVDAPSTLINITSEQEKTLSNRISGRKSSGEKKANVSFFSYFFFS